MMGPMLTHLPHFGARYRHFDKHLEGKKEGSEMSLKDKGRKPDAVLFQLACGRVKELAAACQ